MAPPPLAGVKRPFQSQTQTVGETVRPVCSRGLRRARAIAAIGTKKLSGTVNPYMRILADVGNPNRPLAILRHTLGKLSCRTRLRCAAGLLPSNRPRVRTAGCGVGVVAGVQLRYSAMASPIVCMQTPSVPRPMYRCATCGGRESIRAGGKPWMRSSSPVVHLRQRLTPARSSKIQEVLVVRQALGLSME